MTRIVIVDDHALLRNGLRLLIESHAGWSVVQEAHSMAEARRKLRQPDWDLAIIDVQLPDGNGIELVQQLRSEGVRGAMLVHSAMPDSAVAVKAFRAAANGFINKGCTEAQLTEAIQRVAAGGRYVSPEFAEELAATFAMGQPVQLHDSLSDREKQVLSRIAKGMAPAQIAADIGINPTTISTYRQRILTKLKLKNSMDIMRYAIQHQLVDL